MIISNSAPTFTQNLTNLIIPIDTLTDFDFSNKINDAEGNLITLEIRYYEDIGTSYNLPNQFFS